MIYKVCRPFTYDGIAYERGDFWEPLGFRTDKAIITAKLVTSAPEPEGVQLSAVLEPKRKPIKFKADRS